MAIVKRTTTKKRPILGSSHSGQPSRSARPTTARSSSSTTPKRPTKGSSGPVGQAKKKAIKKSIEPAKPKKVKKTTSTETNITTKKKTKAKTEQLLESTVTTPKAPKKSKENLSSRALALAIAAAGLDKKATGVVALDLVDRPDLANFLVIMSGRSDRHVLSIADAIEEQIKKPPFRIRPLSVDGRIKGLWVVLDYGDVLAHVFQEETRSYYDFDALWKDMKQVPLT